MRYWLFILVLLAASATPLHAATYYVRKTGNDGNTGTATNQAWLTIQKAATTVSAGDTIYVGAGTYNQEIASTRDGTALNPIKFIADTTGTFTGDAGNVIITSSTNQALDIDYDQYLHFIGFKISGGTYQTVRVKDTTGVVLQDCEIYSSGGEGIYLDAGTATFTRCIIRNNTTYGVEVYDNGTATFTDCDIYSNSADGVRVQSTGTKTIHLVRTQIRMNNGCGIYTNGETINLTNCLIRDNTSDAIRQLSGTVTIWHSTLYGNSDGIEQTGGTMYLRNSIIANNASVGLRYTGGTLVHTYNCISSNTGGNFSGAGLSTGETTTSPKFWSASCLELQDGSPCINTGTATSNPATNDLDQVSRPREGGYDMGCYETVTVTYTDLVDAYTQLDPYAWWRLNETSGVTATDQKGNHHGTYQNGTLLNKQGVPSGSYNKAAEFDGVDDRVNVGTVNPTVTAMSFVGWLRADTFSASGADLLVKSSGTVDSNYFWGLSTSQSSGTNYLRFRFRAGGSTGVVTATSDGLSTNAWIFVAAVYDGKTMMLYKDGAEIARLSKSGTPDLSGATSAALGNNPTGGRPFDGRLDEMAIFTKALKPREIAAIYASSLKGSVSGTVSVPKLWGIDEDDAQLFSISNYMSPTTTLTSFGRLKWNNAGTPTDFGTNLDNCIISRTGRLYFYCNETFGTHLGPTLLSFDLANASTTQNNIVSIIGRTPTSVELRGIAIDPLNDELYALRNDGWIYVINPVTAAIVRTVGQATGLGESVTTGEDIMFDRYGSLYVLDDTDDELYRINKGNGAILQVYNNGGAGVGVVQGMAWDHVNNRMLVTATDTRILIVSPLSLTGYSVVNGFGTIGLTDVECISFSPTEGLTGISEGVRVIKWAEKK